MTQTYKGDDSGAYPVAIRDQGVSLGKVNVFDFVGAGFSVVRENTVGVITVSNPDALTEEALKPTGAQHATVSRASANFTDVTTALTKDVGTVVPSTDTGGDDDPATDEIQVVTVTAEGGTFTLTFDGDTTTPIAFDATAAAVEAALEALESIGVGNVSVAGSAGGPYTVTFIEDLGETNVPEMTASGTDLVSGTLLLVAVALSAGDVVTDITFMSGGTAAVAPTHQWFGLFSAARVALALSADDEDTAWGANAEKTLELTSPYTVPTTGLYYLGIVVAATTLPSLLCAVYTNTKVANLPPILQGTSDIGLTTPPALPFTADTLTVVANRPFAYTG